MRAMDLARAIDRLEERQRTAIKLRLEGYSYEQIARFVQCREDDVKSRVQNAKRMLRIALGPKSPSVGKPSNMTERVSPETKESWCGDE